MISRNDSFSGKGPSDVFLIASPLQAINAIEACYAFGIEPANSAIIRIDSDSAINDRQLRMMLADETWGQIHVVDYRGANLRAWFNRMRRLDTLACSLAGCKRLFIGDYGFDLARHFYNKVQPGQLVLLDDGSATIELIQTQKDPTRVKYFHRPPFTTRRKLMLKRALGMRDQLRHGLTYFTVYNVSPEPGSSVIHNSYQHLQLKSSSAVDPDTLFFVGTTRDDIPDEEYIAVVSRALKHLGNIPTRFYLPHRHENPERLARLTEELGIIPLRFDTPIEYAICHQMERLPHLVAGFASTAFDTLQAIFGSRLKLRVFYITPPRSPIYQNLYADYYAYYQRSYPPPAFEVIFNY